MSATKGKSVVKYCEARTRAGKLCKLPAGHGTQHVGRGRCSRHGGKTPNHERKAAREDAREFLRGWDGALVPIDPLDAAQKAVELAHGRVEHSREKMLDLYLEDETPSSEEHERYRLALQDLSRMTEAANRAGVADRMFAITERMAEQITLAFEQAAMGVKMDAEVRATLVKLFAAHLAPLEGVEHPLLDAGP